MPCDETFTCAAPMAGAEGAEVVSISVCVCVKSRSACRPAASIAYAHALGTVSHSVFLYFFHPLSATPPCAPALALLPAPTHVAAPPRSVITSRPPRTLPAPPDRRYGIFIVAMRLAPSFFSALCSLSVCLSHSGRLLCQHSPPSPRARPAGFASGSWFAC